MTPEQIQHIRNTWSVVITSKKEVGELFYHKLFEIAPHLRPMFKGDVSEQAGKLVSKITVAVTKLDKLDEILPEVKALSIRHVKYGVKPEQFLPVGEALLWTLENNLGIRWTVDVAQSWVTLYTILADAMKSAMADFEKGVK